MYIGFTTNSIEVRLEHHLKKGKKERTAFVKALHKYGVENFDSEQIDVCFSKEDANVKERYWIEFYNTYKGEGYNLTEGGDGIANMSEEVREKIRKTKTGSKLPSLQGVPRDFETKLKISRALGAKRVRGVHKNWGYEVFYDYPTQAKKDGFNPSLVCAVIKGKRPHHKGYIFEYVDDANPDLISESKDSEAVQRIDDEPTTVEYNSSTRPQPLDK